VLVAHHHFRVGVSHNVHGHSRVFRSFQVRGPACGSMVPETCFVDARSSGRISVAKLDSYGPHLFGAFSARFQV
jgi:hypothetical protein